MFLPHFDVFCNLLLNRRTATWNLFVLYNKETKFSRARLVALDQTAPSFSTKKRAFLSSSCFTRLSTASTRFFELSTWPASSWLDSSVGRVLHRHRRGHWFKSRSGLNFFQVFRNSLVEYITARTFSSIYSFIRSAYTFYTCYTYNKLFVLDLRSPSQAKYSLNF